MLCPRRNASHAAHSKQRAKGGREAASELINLCSCYPLLCPQLKESFKLIFSVRIAALKTNLISHSKKGKSVSGAQLIYVANGVDAELLKSRAYNAVPKGERLAKYLTQNKMVPCQA